MNLIEYILSTGAMGAMNAEVVSRLAPGTAAKVMVRIAVAALWAIVAGLVYRTRTETVMAVKETSHFTWTEDPQFQTWQTTVERDGFTVTVVMQVDELDDPGTNDVFGLLATASRADIELGHASLGLGRLSADEGPGPDEYADHVTDTDLIPEAIDRARTALARLRQ